MKGTQNRIKTAATGRLHERHLGGT